MEAQESGNTDVESAEPENQWVASFCSMRGNEFFCEVDDDYIADDFNLTGLSSCVPMYDYAREYILVSDADMLADVPADQHEALDYAAETLYGLIHARFILTSAGLELMKEKFTACAFGLCPRVMCNNQAVLPVGQSDTLGEGSVKIFCPKCRDIYCPRSSRYTDLDGAFWGTTFPHLFMMTYPELIPPRPKHSYVPTVYGFRIHSSAPINKRDKKDDDVGNTAL